MDEEYQKEYYHKNKEKIREQQKIWYLEKKKKVRRYNQKNKKKIKERDRIKYQRNKEKISEQQKKYYEENKEEIKKKRRDRYIKNKHPITQEQREYNNRYSKNRYKNDIQFNIRKRMYTRFNNAIKKYINEDKITISRNKNIDYKAIIEHLKPFPENLKDYDIDHIIPLSTFDLTDKEQFKKAWNPINSQWLLSCDNESKGNKIDFDKYPEQKEVFSRLNL